MLGPTEYRKALEEIRPRLPGDPDVDEVLAELKRKGFSQVECIRAVVELGLCGQTDAKRTVHFSAAWSSTRKQSERLHAEVEEAFHESPRSPE